MRLVVFFLGLLLVSSLLPNARVSATEPVGVEAAKWSTDDPVRRAMKAVRDIVVRDHSLVTHRRMPPAGARAFHASIKSEMERMLAETKVEGEAQAALRTVAAEIAGGAEAVAGMRPAVEPIDGIVAIDDALANYAGRFDDPGWQPLR